MGGGAAARRRGRSGAASVARRASRALPCGCRNRAVGQTRKAPDRAHAARGADVVQHSSAVHNAAVPKRKQRLVVHARPRLPKFPRSSSPPPVREPCVCAPHAKPGLSSVAERCARGHVACAPTRLRAAARCSAAAAALRAAACQRASQHPRFGRPPVRHCVGARGCGWAFSARGRIHAALARAAVPRLAQSLAARARRPQSYSRAAF